MKKQRRNTTMATVILLMLLVSIATTILLGRTFAKYTSSATGTDTATVAKWSFKVGNKEIATTAAQTIDINLFSTIKDSDLTSDEEHVASGKIAPGTSGSFDLTVENSSEVAAKYAISLEITEGTSLPIKYAVKTDGTQPAESDWKDTIDSVSETEIAVGGTGDVKVYWKWAFDGDDTAIGIAARESATKVTVKATVTATQVD